MKTKDLLLETVFPSTTQNDKAGKTFGDLVFRPIDKDGQQTASYGFQNPVAANKSCETNSRWNTIGGVGDTHAEQIKAGITGKKRKLDVDCDQRNIAHFAAATGCLAAFREHYLTREMLMAPDKDGNTACHFAYATGEGLSIVDMLVAPSVVFCLKNKSGQTPTSLDLDRRKAATEASKAVVGKDELLEPIASQKLKYSVPGQELTAGIMPGMV